MGVGLAALAAGIVQWVVNAYALTPDQAAIAGLIGGGLGMYAALETFMEGRSDL